MSCVSWGHPVTSHYRRFIYFYYTAGAPCLPLWMNSKLHNTSKAHYGQNQTVRWEDVCSVEQAQHRLSGMAMGWPLTPHHPIPETDSRESLLWSSPRGHHLPATSVSAKWDDNSHFFIRFPSVLRNSTHKALGSIWRRKPSTQTGNHTVWAWCPSYQVGEELGGTGYKSQ